MPEAYDVHDAQFIQSKGSISAADALLVGVGPAPAGKIWSIIKAMGVTSVAETQTFWFAIQSAANVAFPITRPASFSLAPAVGQTFPCLTEGMEIKLYPGETLYFYRAAATAGSTMTIYASFIETEMQFYVELDKYKLLRRRQSAMMESEPIRRGASSFSRGSPGGREGRERPSRY